VSDHALLVGCDAYPEVPGGDLRAAVRDALSVREWLLSEGGLARQDITLYASCSDQGARPAPGEADGPASRTELARAVARLVEGPGGRRLYVYFAGHGCQTDPLNALQSRDAILLSGFTPDEPGSASVGVDDLRRRLTMAPFREIVLIVDACRNLPFREPFGLAGLGRDRQPPAGGPGGTARVFVLQATAPGETAAGSDHEGEWRGVVSRALTDGLRGAGAAKIFDDTDSTGRPYQVRWSTLCSYVAESVRGQSPRYFGEGDLVLASFKDGSFDPVRLDVGVGEGPAREEDLAQLRVRVTWPVPDGGEDGALDRPGPAPVTLQVPPRRHRIAVRAGQLAAKRSFDVYADATVQLDLRRPVPRGSQTAHWPAPEAAGWGGVELSSADPAAVLQMRDGAGAVQDSGAGRLRAGMAPGSYTAVAIGPGGVETHQPADVFADEWTSIRLSPVPTGGWPRRPGPLTWASPAAWIAGAAPGSWSAASGGGGIVLVAVEAEQEAGDLPRSPGLRPVRSRPGNRPMLVWAHLSVSAPPRAVVEVQGVWLEVPALEGVVTSITVTGAGTSVGLFDTALLEDPGRVVLLDRAQDLLGAGRSRAAQLLLTGMRRDSPSRVAGMLLEGIGSSAAPPMLARGRPAADAPALLGGTPWAVVIRTEPPPRL
jgi:hypothetical protein